MGVGMRITEDYGEQLTEGIFNLMKKMGIWLGDAASSRKPLISKNPDDVSYLNASIGGLFLPKVHHWEELKEGDLIGQIIDPLSGKILDEVLSPVDGILFTIREYPIVDEGSLIGRLLRNSLNIQKRFWPIDNTDINRMFPGYDLGETTQRIADGVFKEIMDYKYGIQFTSFYMPGEFMPHVRMMDEGYSTVEEALKFEMPYVVIRNVRPYDTATLNYNWQVWNTQAFSFYTTTTTSINQSSAGQSVLSIMKFLSALGIIKYQHGEPKKPSVVIRDTDMASVRTAKSGIFEPLVKVGDDVKEGTPLANIINPYDGEVMETLYAPMDSKVFFMHSEPLTYADTAVVKLV